MLAMAREEQEFSENVRVNGAAVTAAAAAATTTSTRYLNAHLANGQHFKIPRNFRWPSCIDSLS